MTKEDALQKLEYYTDDSFSFNERQHKYRYGNEEFISVTTFLSKFHKPFDFNYWVKKKAEEDDVTVQEKKEEWRKINERANFIGSYTHDWIENYYKGIYQPLPTDKDVINRINKFNNIFSEKLNKLTPLKFEQKIFSKKLKIAGMIDSLFLYNGNIIMVDYKTNKKFNSNGGYDYLLHPFDTLHQNHLNEYSIQLSLYSLILEEVGIDVRAMYLLYIGPDHENDDGEIILNPAKIYRSLDLRNELKMYFENDIFYI
jgi:ATP-dependent exoDNAse (exonuclease V) beta subunit